MSKIFFKVTLKPDVWVDKYETGHKVVTMIPWERTRFSLGEIMVKGRKSWNAPIPIWRNEVIYYNLAKFNLVSILNKVVIHHTNNSNSILKNEKKQQSKGYAALGYHFFIDKTGDVYEGRPLKVMGSHAGVGKNSGATNDPDWGSIGIVLQGDYHHADDIFFHSKSTKAQLDNLKHLVTGIKDKYLISQLLMHREINTRSGASTVCPGDHLVPHIKALRKKLEL